MRATWTILGIGYLFSFAGANTAISSIPDCSLDCLATIVPEYCGSLTNITCLCTSAIVAEALAPCVFSACNVTESLRLEGYQAEVCGTPVDRTRVDQQLHVTYSIPALTVFFLLLRIFSRLLMKVGLGPDDFLMIAAEITFLVDVSTGVVITLNGFGEHTYSLTIDQITTSLKFFYISEMFYLLTITLTKLSLLLFFRRVFPNETFRRIVWILFGFIIASNFSFIMVSCFQCTPFHGNWTNWMYKVPPVKCINRFAAIYTAAGFSIVHDIMILVLPLPLLWKLQVPWQKKIHLSIMFGAGSFVIACSIMRLPSLLKLEGTTDPSYDQAPIIIWTTLEQSVGIICGCLPATKSLVTRVIPALKMSLKSSKLQSPVSGLDYTSRSRATNRSKTIGRNFIELSGHNSREGSDGQQGSIHSGESQIPFGETHGHYKGKIMENYSATRESL